MGWTYPTFAPSGLPNKEILDDVVPDRPVFSWPSTATVHGPTARRSRWRASIATRPTRRTEKLFATQKGDATGALKEAAGDLVATKTPVPTRAERLDALRKGIHEANRVGLTRVHSAGQDFEYLDLYDELRSRGELTLRFYIAYFLDPPGLTPESTALIENARRK